MQQGYIKLYRQIHDNPVWLSEPFSRGQAWVDLLLLANYKPGSIMVRGNRIDLDRGQVGWSVKALAERWKWSRGRVSRFLLDLEVGGQQIEHQKTAITSVITICNYDKYQQDGQQNGQQTDIRNPPKRTSDGQQNGQQKTAVSRSADNSNDKPGTKTDSRTNNREHRDTDTNKKKEQEKKNACACARKDRRAEGSPAGPPFLPEVLQRSAKENPKHDEQHDHDHDLACSA